jgi:hypothetical protein
MCLEQCHKIEDDNKMICYIKKSKQTDMSKEEEKILPIHQLSNLLF